jgi:hypothetical protein
VDKKLIYKMIRNSFLQYNHLAESIPLTEEDYEELFEEVHKRMDQDIESNLHEIVQDIIYDYLTEKGSPW